MDNHEIQMLIEVGHAYMFVQIIPITCSLYLNGSQDFNESKKLV